MKKPVRYQKGHLYQDHGAWFVRYRECVLGDDGTIERRKRSQRLGSVAEYPRESDIEPLRVDFMQGVNAGKTTSSCATLKEFVEKVYLPFVKDEKRPSTYKSYKEIWERHLRDRVGHIRLDEFRTVDARKVLKAISDDHSLTKTTLQHIKSMLSGVFTHAKNEGAYDGINPIKDAQIPSKARRAGETYAYDLNQIVRILDALPALPKAVVATAAFAGLREGELAGLEWRDYDGLELNVSRSIWRGIVNAPKTPASAAPVPVIPELARILKEYRASVGGDAASGVMFHLGGGERLDLDKLAQRVIRPVIEKDLGLPWHGLHAFRRGIASNLFVLGADEKVVQRILRHSKVQVTKERYIKSFPPDVWRAMDKLQLAIEAKRERPAIAQQVN